MGSRGDPGAYDHRSVRCVACPPFVMAVIHFGHQVRLHHHRDIGCIELRVDHRAVADEAAQAQIALDQRRQRPARASGRSRRDPAAASRYSGAATPGAATRAAPDDSNRDRSDRPPARPDRCRAGWRSRTSDRCGGGTHKRRCLATATASPRGCDSRRPRRNGPAPEARRESASISAMSYSSAE